MLDHVSHVIAKKLPDHKLDIFGADSLLMEVFPYYLLSFIIATGLSIHMATDNPYIVLLIIYAVLPLLDNIFSLDSRNPNASETKNLIERGWEF